MAITRNFFIPADGHSLAATLREITDAGGAGVRVELKPQSPFAGDPEFDSTDLSAWTQVNGANADAINAHTTVLGHLYINANATNSNWNGATRTGPFVHQTLIGDFDVYTRVYYGRTVDAHKVSLLAQSTSDDTDWITGYLFDSAGVLTQNVRSTVNDASSDSGNVATAGLFDKGGFVYLRLVRAGNNFSGYRSFDGKTWTQIGSTVARADFSSDAKVGIMNAPINTSNVFASANDFMRTWPPYVTTSPVGSVVIDSGVSGTTWDMSTFDALINMYQEYNPQVQIGFGTLKYKYGAGESDPPSLNGSYLTEAQMQAEADPVGRYFKLEVQYISANGYEQASFNGATIDGAFRSLLTHPSMVGGMRG